MPKHTVRMNASGAKARRKYVVEIDRTEQKGEIKKIPFREREDAVKLAELLLRKRKSKARVLNPDGQEIYPCQ